MWFLYSLHVQSKNCVVKRDKNDQVLGYIQYLRILILLITHTISLYNFKISPSYIINILFVLLKNIHHVASKRTIPIARGLIQLVAWGGFCAKETKQFGVVVGFTSPLNIDVAMRVCVCVGQ